MSTPIDSPSVSDAPTPAPGAPGGGDGSPVLFDDTATPPATGALGVPDTTVDKPDLPADPNRDRRGHFVRGNTAHNKTRSGYNVKKQAKLRASILACVTTDRLATMVAALLAKACRGDVHAARLILEYSLGKPLPGDILERIARIEGAMDLSDELDPEAIAAQATGGPQTKIAAALYASVEAQGAEIDSQLAALDEPHHDGGDTAGEGN